MKDAEQNGGGKVTKNAHGNRTQAALRASVRVADKQHAERMKKFVSDMAAALEDTPTQSSPARRASPRIKIDSRAFEELVNKVMYQRDLVALDKILELYEEDIENLESTLEARRIDKGRYEELRAQIIDQRDHGMHAGKRARKPKPKA